MTNIFSHLWFTMWLTTKDVDILGLNFKSSCLGDSHIQNNNSFIYLLAEKNNCQ